MLNGFPVNLTHTRLGLEHMLQVLHSTHPSEDCNMLKFNLLLYYFQGWSQVLENQKPMQLSFQASLHGPIAPQTFGYFSLPSDVYQDAYSAINITSKVSSSPFNKALENVLSQVVNLYGIYSGAQLSSLARQEDPWIYARGSLPQTAHCINTLDDFDIYWYFRGLSDHTKAEKS
jgi:uncharacterized phage-associated protein